MPTPHGAVEVAWSQRESDEPLEATIAVPEGAVAVCADGRRLGAGIHGLRIAAAESA